MTNWITIARAATFTVPGFKFADGGNLDLRLRYRTLGVLAPDRSNAILMLHGTTGSGAQFLQPTTADFLFDPSGTSGLRRDSSERPEDIANGHAYH
jgi:homoserine O-acetyltransferase/O-succinyltransferase